MHCWTFAYIHSLVGLLKQVLGPLLVLETLLEIQLHQMLLESIILVYILGTLFKITILGIIVLYIFT